MLEKAQNVIVHDESEDDQDEDEADLNKSFLGFDAEVVTERAFDGEHGDVAAVEDWKWKQVHDGEIQTDERHHRHQAAETRAGGFAGHADNSNRALHFFQRNFSDEELADEIEHLSGEALIEPEREGDGVNDAAIFLNHVDMWKHAYAPRTPPPSPKSLYSGLTSKFMLWPLREIVTWMG